MSRGNDETNILHRFGRTGGTINEESGAEDILVFICFCKLVEVSVNVGVAIEELKTGQSLIDDIFKRSHVKGKFGLEFVNKGFREYDVFNIQCLLK